PGPDAQHEKEGERRGGKAFRIRLRPVRFPESHSLRLVLAMEVRVAELPGANGLPPLWKPGIRAFYRRSLEAFRPAYAKPGLRGLQFGDEINVFHQPLLTARTYLDLRQDAAALGAYRDWLARRVGSIQELNRQFGAGYTSFDEVPWRVPLHPYTPELARTDAAAEREESWAGAQTWGFADTVEQVRTISRVQNEFRVWFYGHWLAEYAKLAKEIIGPVPVFVCSAAIGGEADQYLALHRWALREGVDGLIRNHYGHGGEEERYALASLARWMASVQQESGGTKHLWANEIGYVHPRVTDDEWAAKEASERGSGASFGSQWAFPSRESLREMLLLLSRYGYRGFNRFLMNPSAPRAVREVEWMADLRKEIVPYVAAARPAGRVPEEPAPPGMGLGFPMQNTALGGPFQPRNHRQDADATPARAAKATPPAAQQLGVPMKVGPAQIVDYVDPTYGAKIRQLRKDDGHEHNFYYYRDPWNADGSRMLAIQSDLEQKNWRVCLYDGEGVFLKELFPIEKYDWRLCWDRNDPNLLYTWKGSDLFRFRVSDGEAELLKSFAPLGLKPNGPSCNQAGDRILVITSDNVFRSYRLPEMDEERTFKINVPEGCFVGWDKPHYIGYRNYIDTAYRGADPSQQAIVVHDDTGAVVHKFDAMGGGGHYDFSPDGKLAYFKLPTGGRGAPETPFEIHIVNLDGSGDRVLFRVPRRQAHFHNLHLSWPSRVNDWFVAGFFPSTPSSSGQTRYEPPFDEILLIRLDGTTQYLARTGTVYSAPAGRGKAGDMFWAQTLPSPSADGQRICFNSNRSGTIDLHILFLDATGN
ncbi:MAG: hypothetical protein FJ280_15565, partial [Planctomycetes bacterium]|nr:hypothetical protein [Planctomycetota bacterium]